MMTIALSPDDLRRREQWRVYQLKLAELLRLYPVAELKPLSRIELEILHTKIKGESR